MTLSSSDVTLAHQLSRFFRQNEKEILCGRKKLSLTSSVLCTLNRIFASANHCSDNSCDLIKNVLFLKSIVNNAIALKILNNAETVQGGINLSAFHMLWLLELKKIPIHLLLGIAQLQKQLEILICSGSVFHLEAFTVNGTCSNWVALRHLDLSHNYLEKIDEFIKLFPNLETLNVSHNKLRVTNGLQHLHKLNAVNLGYNLLESLPVFYYEVFDSLKKLCLRNNKIEDLGGLEYLRNLEDLDLSYNCLSEPSLLRPLNKLPYLKVLKLVGNPVVLHPQYKAITVKNLHLNVCTIGLCLDNCQLTKKQMFNIRKIRDISSGLTNSSPIQINVADEDKDFLGDLDGPSVICNITFTKESNITEDKSKSEIIENSISQSSSPNLKEKEINVKELDNSEETAQLPYSKENIEKELELLSCEVTVEDNLAEGLKTSEEVRASDAKSSEMVLGQDVNVVYKDDAEGVLEEQKISENITNEDIEVILSEVTQDEEIQSDSEKVSNENKRKDIYTSDKTDDDEGIESDIFLLEKEIEEKKVPVFVSVGRHNLMERDILTSSILDSLDLRVLESVKKTGEQTLCLKFNMLRKSRRERIYHAENEEIADELFKILKRHVDECNLKNIVENALMCLKCEARFSRNQASQQIVRNESSDNLPSSYDSSKGSLKQIDCCPNCSSSMIFKDTNCPVDKIQNFKDSNYLLKSEDSQQESNSSNRKSIFSSLRISPKLSRKEVPSASKKKGKKVRSSSFDYSNAGGDLPQEHQQTSVGSYDNADNVSTKSDNSRDVLLDDSYRTDFKRSSSDITVLSDPSQSGIGLVSGNEFDQTVELNSPLDDGTFCNLLTSSVRMNAEYADENKNSSELFQVNSSSDSEASSVCTALENYNSGSSSNICSNSFLRNVEKSTNKEDNANPNTNLPYKQAELLRNLENEDNANMSFRSTENKDDASKQIIDNLININHALKLHLELNVFDMDEEFKVAAEVFMMMHNSMTTIMGLLVLSSKKIYFLKLGENFRDEPKNCVTVMEKKNLNQLNSVNILLGNQGFTLNWSTEKYHTCLFKDADHCNCFVTYFTDFIEESKCACPTFRTSAETNLQQVVREVFLAGLGDKKYPPDDVDMEVLMFLLIESCSLDKDGSHPVAIVASSTEICLTQILFAKWTKSTKSFCPVERYRPVAKQKIINIVSLHLCLDTCKVGLHFLDEDANDEFCWSLRTKTRTTLYSLFNTVKELWEKQFGIELICTEDCKYNSETTKEEAATKFVL